MITAGRFLQRKKYGSSDGMFSIERQVEVRVGGVVDKRFHCTFIIVIQVQRQPRL